MKLPRLPKKLPNCSTLRLLFLAVALGAQPLDAIAAQASGAATNWLAALTTFERAGNLIGDRKFDAAQQILGAAQTSLTAPYSEMATQFVQQISNLIRETEQPRQIEGAAALCASMQAHGAALKLRPPKNLSAPDDEEEDTVAWSLFESGDLKSALVRYKRKLAQERIPVYQDYFRKQVQMIRAWDTNATNPAFALELVRERYMKGYERKADSLGALRQLQRVLPHVKADTNGVQIYQQFITCLSALRDTNGREAWENKLLAEFKSDAEACAGVYYDRGIRAYHERRDYETSLTWMRKVATEFTSTKLWGDAQYSVGLILQDQKKFDEAIAALAVIFPSKLNDYALEPGSSEDCKNYRYKAALRTSECYESKNDLAQALEFAKHAASKYPYVSFCSFCQKQGREAAAKRVADLEKKIVSTK